ncbi:TIGR04338 family metallohydrolase [Mycobacterium sp. 94-17]|uniref:TIGR04338 family metallohydrolase n=1 Tax=Mycobacterium sp. 94-17 TaxID=2986147 RepID=UPI002D1E60EB|nr:TIGR04338 family metallohydrolase [Mycobacterium sp. 94-17]MEB4210986.1 TIGR04338 family metallohydrolase [Mycobacterium sp. 94-17]
MSRDFQRARVYRAEHCFTALLDESVENPQIFMAGSTLVLPPEAKFSTPATVQAYVDRVSNHPTVVDRYGSSRVTVRKRNGVSRAHYQLGEIAVPDAKWALRETVILHELAHHFSRDGHGPQFVGAFLDLIDAAMGVQAQLVLRILFGESGVCAY